MKHLIKGLEWQDDSYENRLDGIERIRIYAESPTHSYLISDETNDKYSVLKTRFRDKHTDYCTGFTSIESAQEFSQDDFKKKIAVWFESDPLTDTVNWFKEAKPDPTIEDECVQQGVMFEEMCELLDAFGLSESDAARGLKHLAYLFKTKQPYAIKLLANLTSEQRIERLDAMCDIVVTAAGSSYTSKDDFIGALTEVNKSNWSKFENGKPLFDDNGKIIKGSDYFKPNLDKFIGGSENV